LFFYLSLLLIYGYSGQILSLFFIEQGGSYLNELQNQSHSNGAMSLLILIVTFAIMINYIFFTLVFRNLTKVRLWFANGNNTVRLINVLFIFAYISIIFLYGNAYGSAGGNRVIYRHDYLPSWAGIFIDLQWIPVLVLGLLYINNKKKEFFIFLILHLFFRVLFGEKFTMLVQLLYISFIPYVIFFHQEINVNRFIKIVLFFGVLLGTSIFLNYFFIENAGFERIEQRIAQQGQLWWYVVNNYLEKGGSISVINEFFSYNKGDCQQGMDLLMCKSMSPSLYQLYIEKQYVLTSGYPSILLLYFGPYGIILFLFASPLFLLPLVMLYVSLKNKKILASIISFRVFFSFFSFYAIGNMHDLLNLKTLIYFLLWLGVYSIPKIVFVNRKACNYD
ncbi:O165 family O-antigen polymerase, partial [Escherichia coli]|nr:O165 family O-antigen polymerase [Escherichia coli]